MPTEVLQVLNMRKALCKAAIKIVSDVDDPRREDALTHYNAQLHELDRQITEITGEIPPVIIGLQTAELTTRILI